MQSLLDKIYVNNQRQQPFDDEYFKYQKTIKKKVGKSINKRIVHSSRKESQTFLNTNTTKLESSAYNTDIYPSEYLVALEVPSLPKSNLHLKVGCLYILLKTITPKNRPCNGS